MGKQERNRSWILILTAIAAFALPLYQLVTMVCVVLLLILRLSDPEERTKMKVLLTSKKLLLGLPLFYLMHLTGLLWTENFSYAGLDLQIKAGFLLLPLIVGTLVFTDVEFRKVLFAFVYGCTLASVVLLFNAFIKFNQTGLHTSFFYIEYGSLLMHPTYLSIYLNTALLILFSFLQEETHDKKLKFYSAGIFFLFIQILLLSARTAEVVAFFTFITAVLYSIKSRRLSYLKTKYLVVTILAIISSYFILHHINNRFNQVQSAMQANQADPEGTIVYNSTTGRIEIWRESLEILQDHWLLGTGTGDVKVELLKVYRRHDFRYALDKKLNAHNQFLQTWLTLGIVGLILLFIIVCIPLLMTRYPQNLNFAMFSTLILLNAMTECILEVQRGALFFSFIYSLFSSNKINSSPSA